MYVKQHLLIYFMCRRPEFDLLPISVNVFLTSVVGEISTNTMGQAQQFTMCFAIFSIFFFIIMTGHFGAEVEFSDWPPTWLGFFSSVCYHRINLVVPLFACSLPPGGLLGLIFAQGMCRWPLKAPAPL